MKRKSPISAILAGVLFCALLAGCGETPQPTPDPAPSASTSADVPTATDPATTESTEPTATDPTDPADPGQPTQPQTTSPAKSTYPRPWVTATTTNSTGTTTQPTTPVQPAAAYTKAELLALVQQLTYQDDGYAIGVHLYGNLDVRSRVRTFEKRTGKAPAFIDFDMNALPYEASERAVKSAVDQLAAHVKSGGFVTITDHWLTPKKNVKDASKGGANNSRDTLTRDEYLSVMTEGTALNKNFLDELAIKAKFLEQLRAAGIPVIYRPLHEGNMGWSWWGINKSTGITGKDVAALYRYVHDYFVRTCGLDNILWQFNTGINSDQDVLCDWYPGDAYVDLLSLDWYLPNIDYRHYYLQMTQKFGEKGFAISEYGGDGNYDVSKYPLRDTMKKLEDYLDMGAKVAYVGLYFDMPGGQEWTLTDRAIGLDGMSSRWAKVKG